MKVLLVVCSSFPTLNFSVLIIRDAISLRFFPSQTRKPKASHYVTTIINDLERDIGIAVTKDRVSYIAVCIAILSFTEKLTQSTQYSNIVL